MSKLFYEAMRTLPHAFMDDKTRHCYNEDMVFVVNPRLPPHMYTAACGWEAFEPKFPATSAIESAQTP